MLGREGSSVNSANDLEQIGQPSAVSRQESGAALASTDAQKPQS